MVSSPSVKRKRLTAYQVVSLAVLHAIPNGATLCLLNSSLPLASAFPLCPRHPSLAPSRRRPAMWLLSIRLTYKAPVL